MSKPALLLIDDDPAFRRALKHTLEEEYEVRSAASASEANTLLAPPPDIILLDLRLNKGDVAGFGGLELLEELQRFLPEVPVVMITAYGDVDMAVKCMSAGAVDFLQKGRADSDEIHVRLHKALGNSLVARRASQLERDLSLVQPRKIIGECARIQETKQFIEAAARDGSVTVVVRGETGTGKELVARAIHASGRRKLNPFVPVTLNALPLSMMEAELFGHETGAFTDARTQRIGYLERAHGGVLFLDEIGDVDPDVQIKLLRFLEEREFCRLGSTKPIQVDIQIVAATNADLETRVREGRFRQDLYFRLKVYELVLPPLRERGADIPLLIETYLQLFARQGKKMRPFSATAMQELCRFSWPGNVRQLKNTVEAALFWAEIHGHDTIEWEDLPADVREDKPGSSESTNLAKSPEDCNLQEALARMELTHVERALLSVQGKKTQAWSLLGYNDRFTLNRRVRRILEQFPLLEDEFPEVKARFGEHTQ